MSNVDPIKIIRQLLFGKSSVTVQEVETAVDAYSGEADPRSGMLTHP